MLSVSRSSGNVGSAFDGSLGIDGAWVHSNTTGCIPILQVAPIIIPTLGDA